MAIEFKNDTAEYVDETGDAEGARLVIAHPRLC